MKIFLISGAILCAIAVILGAFGAHGLKNRLSSDLMVIYQTAVQYHFLHAVGLLIVGILAQQLGEQRLFFYSGLFMLIGIGLFSGSLYILAITEIRWLGAITPLGGLSFIIGWFLLALAIYS